MPVLTVYVLVRSSSPEHRVSPRMTLVCSTSAVRSILPRKEKVSMPPRELRATSTVLSSPEVSRT